MLMSAQSRAARALLGWSQADLAKAAGLGVSTVRNFEKGRSDPYSRNLEAIRSALEEAGIEFIAGRSASMDGGPGVRLKSNAGGGA
jgi:transcriptional regulator with XRE-family HTH domain